MKKVQLTTPSSVATTTTLKEEERKKTCVFQTSTMNLKALAKVTIHIFAWGTDCGAGKSCPLEELVEISGVDKVTLTNLLKDSPRFSISNRKRVSFDQAKKKESLSLDNPKTKSLCLLLLQIHQSPTQRWPQSEIDFKTVTQSFMGDELSFDSFLSEILYFGLATIQDGKIEWNESRMKKVIHKIGIGYETTSGTVHQTTRKVVVNEINGVYVDTLEKLEDAVQSNPVFRPISSSQDGAPQFVALGCEGIPQSLELLQIGLPDVIYIFDGQCLGVPVMCEALRPLLTSIHVTKVVHDIHKVALSLSKDGCVDLVNVFDTQLLAEHHYGSFSMGFNHFLEEMDLPLHPSKGFLEGKMSLSENYWTKRPLSNKGLEYATTDVYCLSFAIEKIKESVPADELELLKKASAARVQNAMVNDASRKICFDTTNGYAKTSAELGSLVKPQKCVFGQIPVVECEVEDAIALLPSAFCQKLGVSLGIPGPAVVDRSSIIDIVLDKGRRPECFLKDGKRVFLCEDANRCVVDSEIKEVVDQLGEIGSDNRAGLDRKLHRFSVMRARDNTIAGITIRIGRTVTGNADLILDYVMGSDKSILLLGEPGCGKTTIVREVTRILAEEQNVIVVDTSNEIGGDGVVPHRCIGLARRMMVPSLDKQSAVMIECLQNHTPSCMVIDEIGRPKEVQAARTVRQRGVRIIASAHGNLRSLVKNEELRGLIGGVEVVTMGDKMAKEEANRKQSKGSPPQPVSKTKAQRQSEPTFDLVVELRRGLYHEWRIVTDVAKAVDDILDGRKYNAERRMRDLDTGDIFLEFTTA